MLHTYFIEWDPQPPENDALPTEEVDPDQF